MCSSDLDGVEKGAGGFGRRESIDGPGASRILDPGACFDPGGALALCRRHVGRARPLSVGEGRMEGGHRAGTVVRADTRGQVHVRRGSVVSPSEPSDGEGRSESAIRTGLVAVCPPRATCERS